MRIASRLETEPSCRARWARAARLLVCGYTVALVACSPFEAQTPAEIVEAGAPDAGALVDGADAGSGANERCTLEGSVLALGFDDVDGSRVTDTSGASNHGTVFDGSIVDGVYGKAIAFGAEGASVRVANSPSLDVWGDEFRLAFWINADPLSTLSDEVVITKPWTSGSMESPFHQFAVEIDSNGKDSIDLFIGGGDGVHTMLGFPMPRERWAHIAFTLAKRGAKGYLDGALRTDATSVPIVSRGTDLLLGVDAIQQQPFHGKLDDVRIYQRALSKDEIACLARR